MNITYEQFINERKPISMKEALENYDDLWIEVNGHIAAYNFRAPFIGKEKMRKYTNLIDCLSDYNDWAKPENWTPELIQFMMNRVEENPRFVISDRDWMAHIVTGMGPMNEKELMENYDEIDGALYLGFMKRNKRFIEEGRRDLVQIYSGSPIDYLAFKNEWAKPANWSYELKNLLGRKGIIR
jgi:hypothetical protein